jgi:hypothetical protein
MFHESTQSDKALFNRLCPPAKDGTRKFAPVMLKRLKKLGIQHTNPDDLIEEEVSKFARLDIDVNSITWYKATLDTSLLKCEFRPHLLLLLVVVGNVW